MKKILFILGMMFAAAICYAGQPVEIERHTSANYTVESVVSLSTNVYVVSSTDTKCQRTDLCNLSDVDVYYSYSSSTTYSGIIPIRGTLFEDEWVGKFYVWSSSGSSKALGVRRLRRQ